MIHNDRTSRTDAGEPADGRAPRTADQGSGLESAPALDVGEIVTSIGEAPYVWRIDTDALTWSRNAAEILAAGDAARIASGRAYAGLMAPDNTQSRFDAVMKSTARDDGSGVPYQVQYCLRPAESPTRSSGSRTPAAGSPARTAARCARTASCASSTSATSASSSSPICRSSMRSPARSTAGSLTETLDAIVQDALRFRSSCGFLLVAIDNLANINEAYGFDVADEVIAAVAKRIRARMRGGDVLGRFSGNKFGVMLKNCTPETMTVAADRLLAGVREEVVATAAGPVAVTVTIGGVTAPRHARSVDRNPRARAGDARRAPRPSGRGSFLAYRPNIERDALRRENVRATDEIVAALNERRILLAYEPVVDARTAQARVLRMPDARAAPRRQPRCRRRR